MPTSNTSATIAKTAASNTTSAATGKTAASSARRTSANASAAARACGFTLLELMIALVIVSVLAALAFPSYQQHIRKGNRASGQGAVQTTMLRQTEYFVQNKIFADSLAKLGYSGSLYTVEGRESMYVNAQGQQVVNTDADRTYRIYIEPAPPAPTILAMVAEAVHRQADDTKCFTMALGDKGRRGAWDESGSETTYECW